MNTLPNVNQTVLVRHKSLPNKKSGLVDSVMSKHREVQNIEAVYRDGSVRVASGDVYEVQKHSGSEAAWVTTR